MTTETKDIKALDTVLPSILKAVTEWQTKNTPAVIRKRVMEKLDANSESIMLNLLGFRENWGKWELDHCNGRAGESAAGDFLRKTQQDTIQEWFTNNLLPTMTPTLQAKLKKEFQHEYAEKLQYAVRSAAHERANKDAIAFIAKLAETDDLAGYLKAIQLLNPKE